MTSITQDCEVQKAQSKHTRVSQKRIYRGYNRERKIRARMRDRLLPCGRVDMEIGIKLLEEAWGQCFPDGSRLWGACPTWLVIIFHYCVIYVKSAKMVQWWGIYLRTGVRDRWWVDVRLYGEMSIFWRSVRFLCSAYKCITRSLLRNDSNDTIIALKLFIWLFFY